MPCPGVRLLEGLAKICARLPQAWLLRLGRGLAWLAWPLLGERRRIARINVDLCFPELDPRARRKLADASVVNTVIGALELARAWHAPAARLRGLAEIEGLERLRVRLDAGQGVLLMCGHFTHTELAVRLLSEALGRPVRVVVRRHNHACLEAWFDRARQAVYGPTIGKKDVRGLLRNLMAGQPVVYSADQNFTYQNAFVPFFGVPAATLTATPDIVRRAGAVLLPFWYRREPDGRYRIRIEEPWPGWPSGDPAADAARYMAELETVVRECPEQYLWAHRRFKTRPAGEPPVY
ncbi:lysophospholipid acyltransferase family protein [Arenimonas fontis]|uniref:Lysophospholipid acyltransferase family protein n=1 Tax=Arenimonas fontis TaxID=2608255 RepID=A0A5B2ZB10_9GAMM|nr:lysophospholipid acyltransferase family protein [Arenimonas fontis]KAA2284364.1 lysophospholipid acyltransferase family protein [Arenimonas fontis]